MPVFEVVVGNVGIVYRGKNVSSAFAIYDGYVEDSLDKYGRVGGENVAILLDGEIIKEHDGLIIDEDEE